MEGHIMKKKVIDLNRLPKQEYSKPEIEVIDVKINTNMLIGSPGDSVQNSLIDEEIDDPLLII